MKDLQEFEEKSIEKLFNVVNKTIKEKNFLKICEKKAKRFQSVFKTNTLQVKGENVMRITELLRKSSIALQVDMQSKEETIDYLVDLKQKTH